MAQIVAAALVSHGPLVTGRPEVSKPEQRERVHAGAALKDGVTGLYRLGASPYLIRRVFRAR